MFNLKAIGTAVLLTFSAVTANASILDFTTTSTFSSISAAGATGAVDGVGYSITTTPAGKLTFGETSVGSTCASSGLACEFDGLGVRDDEISTSSSVIQSIIVSFNETVTITGLYFLDLFIARNGATNEVAQVMVSPGGSTSTFDAMEVVGSGASGLAYYGGLSLTGSTFTFTALRTNDAVALADYALAGIELAPIPLPAGLLLLGGALGALGISRRRKAA